MGDELRLENTSAHLKHISLGDAGTIAVPPNESGTPGTVVKFDTQTERDAFEKALATPAVKAWIDAGELVVHRAGSPSPSLAQPAQSQPGQPIPGQPPQPAQSLQPAQPAQHDESSRRSTARRDKE